MRTLPLDVVCSKAFQESSLALRMVHHLLWAPPRALPVTLSAAEAPQTLQHLMASQAVGVSLEEAKALVEEALRVGLWVARDEEIHLSIVPGDPRRD